MVWNFDLNAPEGSWASVNSAGAYETAAPVSSGRYRSTRQVNDGLFGSPIDVEAIDDDVQMPSSSRGLSRPGDQSRRDPPVIVIPDEDLETNAGQSGVTEVEPLITFSRDSQMRDEMNSTEDEMINCELSLSLEHNNNAKRKDVISSSTEELRMPETAATRKEPTFTCPVCLNELVNAYSTICGHVFCEGCIRLSILEQKRCPTCRKQLKMNNVHRVYLPSSTFTN